MQSAQNPRLLTVQEAADRAHVSRDTIRRWADQGGLRVYRSPGGQRRFHPDDVDRVYTEQTTPDKAAS